MTEPYNKDKWLSVAQKLLAKANDPGATEQERQACTDKAAEIIAKYALDAAMAEANDNGAKGKVTTFRITLSNPYIIAQRQIISAVAHFLGCRVVYVGDWSDSHRVQVVTVFGYQSDLDKLKFLFMSLSYQMTVSLLNTPVPPDQHGKTFRTSFCAGFISSINRRFDAIKANAIREHDRANGTYGTGTSETALVLFDRSKAVDEAVTAMYPKLSRGSTMTVRSGRGYNSGKEAGNRADIGQTRVSGNNRRALT